MKRIIYYATLFPLSILLFSCDNFLDKSPYVGGSLNSEADAELMINAAYEPLYFEEAYGRGFFWLSAAGDDFTVQNQGKTEIINVTSFTANANTASNLQSYWAHFYTIIRRANDVLATVPNINMDEITKNRILGEANFLIGFSYWQLVRKYGGVPFYDLENPLETNVPRKTLEESYENIVNYLTKSIEMFHSSGEEDKENFGRGNKTAAWSLLAKVYIYLKRWQDAKVACEEVINNGGHDLLPNYKDVWSIAGEKSPEHIWSLVCTPVRNKGTITSITMLPASITGGQGWNYFSPTASLYNEFEEGDTRREVTLLKIGDDETEGESFKFDGNEILLTKEEVGNWHTNYICVKYNEPYEQKYLGWESGLDIHIIRYSDVLLLHAEAIIMLGGGGPSNRELGVPLAAESFNKVRIRAFGGDESKAISSPSFNDLMHERRCELAYEENRHYDLVRWELAQEIYTSDDREHDDVRGKRNYVHKKNKVFPLPQQEIDNSNGVLVQNPGYAN